MKGKCVGAIVGAAVLATAGTAPAEPPNEPSANASCVGALSVFNQAHPEVFGSRSEVAHLFLGIAEGANVPPGAIYTPFAQDHGPAASC